jgi:hypothetical protein
MAPPKKMDKGKALAIMGFGTSRPLDVSLGQPEKIREILDKALFDRTQEMLHGTGKKPDRKKSIKR